MSDSFPIRPASRSQSRASSRGSVRAPSPSLSLDDPGTSSVELVHPSSYEQVTLVSVRNHMSSLKHTIRHQQAQLQNLESVLHRSSHSASVNTRQDRSPPATYTDLPASPPSSSSPLKLQRRTSSFDILQGIAGPESLLPLPRKDGSLIREGVPSDFSSSLLSPEHNRRPDSPTRSLSRMYKYYALLWLVLLHRKCR